jgi:hypothetical protein
MKACLLAAALAFVLASTASARNAKVYIFVKPTGRIEGLVSGAAPASLMDSANDLWTALGEAGTGLTRTKKRDEARVVVQVLRREEVQGEFRVHVHVTLDGQDADLVGTSTHQWKLAAWQIADQLEAWAKAHPAAK